MRSARGALNSQRTFRQLLFSVIVIFLLMTVPACQQGLNLTPDPEGADCLLLDIPPIRQSTSVSNLCGPTCAEMILSFYGLGLSQYDIGEAICKMVPEYQRMHPTYRVLDCEWPDHYRETYQPIMALYFEGLGYETETTRAAYSEQTGLVASERFDAFMAHLRAGKPLVFHVEGHYMLAIGFDDGKRRCSTTILQTGRAIALVTQASRAELIDGTSLTG